MAARTSAVRPRAPPPRTGRCNRGATSSEATGKGLFGHGALEMDHALSDRQTDRDGTSPGDVTVIVGRGNGVVRTSRASAGRPPSASPENARAMDAITLRSVGQRSLGSFTSIRIIV